MDRLSGAAAVAAKVSPPYRQTSDARRRANSRVRQRSSNTGSICETCTRPPVCHPTAFPEDLATKKYTLAVALATPPPLLPPLSLPLREEREGESQSHAV